MNRWHVAGQSLGLYVEFKKDGQFMPPDAGSIKLTIRDSVGVPLSGFNQAAQADTSNTSVLYTVPYTANMATEPEARYVQVDYTIGGVPCIWKDVYKLSPFLPIAVVPSDVRNILGVRDKELTDEQVDIYEAYFELLRVVPDLEAALVAADDRCRLANRAIALKAALIVLPSMPVRAMKEDALNNASQVRATIDWELLRAGIESELSGILVGVPVSPEGFVLHPLFMVVTPTDRITNA